MEKIGLDFGTTYSVISYLKNEKPEAFLPVQNATTPFQHSLVVKNSNDVLEFGPIARTRVGRKGINVYKGFKMMLAERDKDTLAERGYTGTFMPETITKAYLKDMLSKYLIATNVGQIEKIVVGVPEIWFENFSTIDCRTRLKELLENMEEVKSVKLVSEPAAACAFFVQNYREKTGIRFEGTILLVDYGGGTLDIALCEVKRKGERNQVLVKKRAGAGLNEEGHIGIAGMAFLEGVVKRAIGMEGDNAALESRTFYRAVDSLETALMNKMQEIRDMFEMNNIFDINELEEEFDTIEYDSEEYTITYGMLAKTYNELIRPVLEEKINQIIDYMNENRIDYSANTRMNFKIALVGGFCNFYLTQMQIEEMFHRNASDKRFEDIIVDRRDCEKAIAYGAALIANGDTDIPDKSPYDLGFADNEKSMYFAIKRGDEIKPDQPVMIKNEDGSEKIFVGTKIPMLAFNFTEDKKLAQCRKPLQKYIDKLQLKKDTCFKIGFSLDDSMIITLHKMELAYDPSVDTTIDPDQVASTEKVKLDSIYGLFGDIIEIM